MGISQLGGTSYSRLVTKQNTAGGTALLAATFSVANGGTSTWTTSISSTGAETLILGVGLHVDAGAVGSAITPAEIDIAYGGSGSEQLLYSAFLFSGQTITNSIYSGGWHQLPIPLRVAAGQRIAVRGSQLTTWGTTYAFNTVLVTVPYANIEGN